MHIIFKWLSIPKMNSNNLQFTDRSKSRTNIRLLESSVYPTQPQHFYYQQISQHNITRCNLLAQPCFKKVPPCRNTFLIESRICTGNSTRSQTDTRPREKKQRCDMKFLTKPFDLLTRTELDMVLRAGTS